MNFNKFNWADGLAGRAMDTSTAASPTGMPFFQNFRIIWAFLFHLEILYI